MSQPREAILDDSICRLLVTDSRYLVRFQALNAYSKQIKAADEAIKNGSCQSCSNTVKHTDIYANVRSRVNSFSKQDKRDLLLLLGCEKLSIPLNGKYKDIVLGPVKV